MNIDYKIFKKYRVLSNIFYFTDRESIGGRNETVEIDECMIFRRKYDRG